MTTEINFTEKLLRLDEQIKSAEAWRDREEKTAKSQLTVHLVKLEKEGNKILKHHFAPHALAEKVALRIHYDIESIISDAITQLKKERQETGRQAREQLDRIIEGS